MNAIETIEQFKSLEPWQLFWKIEDGQVTPYFYLAPHPKLKAYIFAVPKWEDTTAICFSEKELFRNKSGTAPKFFTGEFNHQFIGEEVLKQMKNMAKLIRKRYLNRKDV